MPLSTALIILGALSTSSMAHTYHVEQACQADAKECPGDTTVGRNPSNNCEFYPCPLIAVGHPCDAPTGGAVDPCAQGLKCNETDENAVCECKVTEAGDCSVCTVTSSDTIGKPGCTLRLRYNKQN